MKEPLLEEMMNLSTGLHYTTPVVPCQVSRLSSSPLSESGGFILPEAALPRQGSRRSRNRPPEANPGPRTAGVLLAPTAHCTGPRPGPAARSRDAPTWRASRPTGSSWANGGRRGTGDERRTCERRLVATIRHLWHTSRTEALPDCSRARATDLPNRTSAFRISQNRGV